MTQNKIARIAIIGGGPAGLTLARILQTHNIAATVFERENHPNERPQGGTLDLHEDSGLMAVHLAELDEQFRAIARYEDQNSCFISKDGEVLMEDQQEEGQEERPEVDRTALRAMLLDSLGPEIVRWGCNLRTISQADDGTYELQFENGATKTFDLVVGADGAWSRVRPLLSSATPYYTGVTFIELSLDNVDEEHPALAALVGHGSMFSLADNKGLIAQRNGHGHIRIYAGMRVPETWISESGFDASNPEQARAWLLEQFSAWDQKLLALIKECNDHIVVRPLYMLPIGHRWEFHAGVTLLGDAAHLMSPFSGEGVNMAMWDAADLAKAIIECSTLEEAVRSYEQIMFPRALTSNEGADQGLSMAFSPDSATAIIAFFNAMKNDEPLFPSTIRSESFSNDLTLRVKEQGSGRPILVLHGARGPQSVEAFSEELGKHAHVFTPTHPGFEGEPRPEWFTDVDDLALAYIELLERLELQDAIVIGFSFGGWIAAELAVRMTTRLGALILVDAAGIQIDGQTVAGPPNRGAAPNNQQPTGPRNQGPEQNAAREANLATMAVYSQKQGFSDPNLRPRLAHVNIPALVVWGENDPVISPDYGRVYAQSLPNARFELIPDAGHLPQLEQPERLLDLVRAFIETIPANQ